MASADKSLLSHGSKTGISYQEDYEYYFKYLHKGLYNKKSYVLDIFKVWNEVFYPGVTDTASPSTTIPTKPDDENLEALLADLSAQEDADEEDVEAQEPETCAENIPTDRETRHSDAANHEHESTAAHSALFPEEPRSDEERDADGDIAAPTVFPNTSTQIHIPAPTISRNMSTRSSMPAQTISQDVLTRTHTPAQTVSRNVPTRTNAQTVFRNASTRTNISAQTVFRDVSPTCYNPESRATAPRMVSVIDSYQIVKLTGTGLTQYSTPTAPNIHRDSSSPLSETSSMSYSQHLQSQAIQPKISKRKRTPVIQKHHATQSNNDADENQPQRPSQPLRRSVRVRKH